MKIKPIIFDRVKTSHTNFEVDLEICSNVTFITGDSGTGKSAVFSFLRELSSEDGRIICFNYIDLNKDCKDTIRKAKGKLFIIDNADILLDDETRQYIAMDTENQYIIIGRNPTGLLLSRDEFYKMDSEKIGEVTLFHLSRAF